MVEVFRYVSLYADLIVRKYQIKITQKTQNNKHGCSVSVTHEHDRIKL